MKLSMIMPPMPREQMALCFQHALNALARFNADWVMECWKTADALRAQGKTAAAEAATPKCCAKCNGTRYVEPTGTSETIELASSPVLFKRGYGACGEIAACHTGHKIAEAIRAGMDWDTACRSYQVVFDSAPNRSPFYFHAICDDNGKILDPTIGMKR